MVPLVWNGRTSTFMFELKKGGDVPHSRSYCYPDSFLGELRNGKCHAYENMSDDEKELYKTQRRSKAIHIITVSSGASILDILAVAHSALLALILVNYTQ